MGRTATSRSLPPRTRRADRRVQTRAAESRARSVHLSEGTTHAHVRRQPNVYPVAVSRRVGTVPHVYAHDLRVGISRGARDTIARESRVRCGDAEPIPHRSEGGE